jgi:hypothetical protein
MCLHPKLVLMEKGWLVQVAAGQQLMMKLRKRLRKGLMVKRKKRCLMWKKINHPNYVDMGPLVFRAPTNPTWRVKVSYKGKTESVRENRRILARTQPRDAYDYRFHSPFQQDFSESVIMTKSKPVVNS